MTQYEAELQSLKTWDEVQYSYKLTTGYTFITTAGHGYLVVPKSDPHALEAKELCKYGFEGKLAYYLEEDCEAPDFDRLIKA